MCGDFENPNKELKKPSSLSVEPKLGVSVSIVPDLLILVSVVLVDSLLSRDFLMPLRSWLSRLSFLKLQTCLRFLFVLFKRADADIRITIHRARFSDLCIRP